MRVSAYFAKGHIIMAFCLLQSIESFAAGVGGKIPSQEGALRKQETATGLITLPDSVERFEKNFTGTNTRVFWKLFSSRTSTVKKGDFETSDQFEERTRDKDKLLSPLNTLDLYAFRVNDLVVKYDADAEGYMISGNERCSSTYYPDTIDVEDIACSVLAIEHKNDFYSGSNSYGASTRVTRTRGLDFAVAFPVGHPAFKAGIFTEDQKKYEGRYIRSGTYSFSDIVRVPLDKAKRFKGMTIAVLFVGKITDAKKLAAKPIRSIPTMDSPEDIFINIEAAPFDLKKIIYYVIQTGDVIGQVVF